MNIPSLNISAVLKRYGLRADKSLGQNFLQDARSLELIAQAAGIQPEDTVLEVGPGLGSLTRYLAASAREVVAVELDERLLRPLEEIIAPHRNVRVTHGNILDIAPGDLLDQPDYLVVANIPYYITSAIIRHLLESKNKPRRIVLTIQKEVAERICAKPGDLSLLALSVQVYGSPRVAASIPAGAFFPAPNVDSAVLVVDIYPTPYIEEPLLDIFFKLTKAGFAQKRKTLRNSLSAGLYKSTTEIVELLHRANIDPMRRAETLSLDEWRAVCALYGNKKAEP
ncbi:MAG TPA: 16S rRNA (adenine(1518)-N(6)/adenine(1519)-N(6))-dimethyltransferase RsmA [Anaerolineales bacterium]|nr:ribosomal RNA small subunit methyltransferase A [Anaerolineales bacterium]HMR98972.1 16S rRNA (adenine(1518)-N(6)/adenine(1519)-N(6))-dimethyltransferase RsmA [Anaerolineales bacterium]HNQ94407.1 16S rRNA (adenine(1518)-N(6)/adenine(1519)-N(6))-dimethyltransferase RsmA [Anaerolineales bacterium]HNS61281.1 16S rRNA (adenine(1518)-N(6)/adenine(1519)-N(6))-dimethyltransferase RsmA [Anaerolineales bacterium]